MLHSSAGSGADDKLYAEDVFSVYLRTGTGADVVTTTGIDMTKGYMLWTKGRSGATDHAIYDSARGVTKDLVSNSTAAETTQSTGLKAVSATGHTIGSLAKMNTSGATYVDFVFRKAPKFFDIVTYTGSSTTTTQVTHGLGVQPELILLKSRSATEKWFGNVFQPNMTLSVGLAYWLYSIFDDSAALYPPDTMVATMGPDSTLLPTSTTFNVKGVTGNNIEANTNAVTYVAYLFATLAGISKVGSYTGNGTSQTIACGFTTGARFILIKRTDSTGDWYIWDTVRGIVAATDPHLSLNTTAAEVTTDDSIDPEASGFIVNQVAATNINVSSATYIYLAIA